MVVSKRPLGSDGEGAVVYIEGPVVWTMLGTGRGGGLDAAAGVGLDAASG